MVDYAALLGATATAIAIYSYIPYFIGIYKGTTKPHSFSWFLWGLLTAIAFVAQITHQAGAGAWVTGYTALACFAISLCGLRDFHENVRPVDWGCLIVALAAIPLWLITDQPIIAVILITLIDYIGTYPTIRKSWHAPHSEVIQTYILSSVKFMLSIFAMSEINFINSFYPLAIVILNFGLVAILYARRRALLSPITTDIIA